MRFYIMTAVVTIIFLIGMISYRFDLWNNTPLPYDDEQVGLDDQIIINFSHVVAENTPKGIAASKFAELLKEKSDGKMIVQIYPNGILYSDENELVALQNGDIQMIAPTISKMTESIPSWQLLDLPFIFENEQEIYGVLHSQLSEELLEELATIHVHGLTFWTNGFKQMAAKSSPLLEVNHFKELPIRTMRSNILKEQFTLLKATPIVTTFNDLYNAIQNNDILAQENTLSNLYSKGFYTMHPRITLSNHGLLAYSVLMNDEFWQSLTPSQQQIIQESLEEMQHWQHTQAIELNEQNLQQLKATKHVQLYTLSDEQRQQWQHALQSIYKSYEKHTHKDYLAKLHEEIERLSE